MGSDDGRWVKEIGFLTLSIVRIFNRLNTRRFGDYICLRAQVKRKKKGGNLILLGPLETSDPVIEVSFMP
jgi:hypothetical protein